MELVRTSWCTREEAAAHLGCSRTSIDRRIQEGVVPVLAVGHVVRIPSQALVEAAREPVPISTRVIPATTVARLLRVSPRTVYRWAEAGAIPMDRERGRWRIRREALLRWVRDCLSEARWATCPDSEISPSPPRSPR